jgi:hypothetical protein
LTLLTLFVLLGRKKKREKLYGEPASGLGVHQACIAAASQQHRRRQAILALGLMILLQPPLQVGVIPAGAADEEVLLIEHLGLPR